MSEQPTFNQNDERNLPRRVSYCPVPTDGVANGVLTQTFSGSKIATQTITLNSIAYVRTLTYTGNNLTTVSAWSEVP